MVGLNGDEVFGLCVVVSVDIEEVVCEEIDVLGFLVLEEVGVDVYEIGYVKWGVVVVWGVVLFGDVNFCVCVF